MEECARLSFLKRCHVWECARTLVGLHELQAVSLGSGSEVIGIVKGQLQQYVTEKYHDAPIRLRTDRFSGSYPTRYPLSAEWE